MNLESWRVQGVVEEATQGVNMGIIREQHRIIVRKAILLVVRLSKWYHVRAVTDYECRFVNTTASINCWTPVEFLLHSTRSILFKSIHFYSLTGRLLDYLIVILVNIIVYSQNKNCFIVY